MKKFLDILIRKPINFVADKVEQFCNWLFLDENDKLNDSDTSISISKDNVTVNINTQSKDSNVVIIDGSKYTCFDLETIDIINDNIEVVVGDSILYLTTSQFLLATEKDIDFINSSILIGTNFEFKEIKDFRTVLAYKLKDHEPTDVCIIQGVYYCGCIDTFLRYAEIPE